MVRRSPVRVTSSRVVAGWLAGFLCGKVFHVELTPMVRRSPVRVTLSLPWGRGYLLVNCVWTVQFKRWKSKLAVPTLTFSSEGI